MCARCCTPDPDRANVELCLCLVTNVLFESTDYQQTRNKITGPSLFIFRVTKMIFVKGSARPNYEKTHYLTSAAIELRRVNLALISVSEVSPVEVTAALKSSRLFLQSNIFLMKTTHSDICVLYIV